jgi:hypothetical protein
MPKISHYEKLIQEKRKKTPFREFVKELGSWDVLNLYKRDGHICRYPDTGRIKKFGDNFWSDAQNSIIEYDSLKGFFKNFTSLQDTVPMQYTLQFGTNDNCEYAGSTFISKNVYLGFEV